MRQFIIGFICAAVLFSSIQPATTDERTERSAILEEADLRNRVSEGYNAIESAVKSGQRSPDELPGMATRFRGKVEEWEKRLLAASTERAAWYCINEIYGFTQLARNAEQTWKQYKNDSTEGDEK